MLGRGNARQRLREADLEATGKAQPKQAVSEEPLLLVQQREFDSALVKAGVRVFGHPRAARLSSGARTQRRLKHHLKTLTDVPPQGILEKERQKVQRGVRKEEREDRGMGIQTEQAEQGLETKGKEKKKSV